MKSKQKFRIIALFLMASVLFTNFGILAVLAVERDDLETSNLSATAKIDSLKLKFLEGGLKPRGQPLRGVGVTDSGQAYGSDAEVNKIQLKDNVMAISALMKEYVARDDTDAFSWAQNDIYPNILSLRHSTGQRGYSANEEIASQLPTRKFAIDQFIFLEFISEAYEISDSSEMYLDLQEEYKWTTVFKAPANSSLHNLAEYGAYWTAMQDNEKYDSQDYNINYNPHPENLIYPLTNNSLWAAASMAHFAKTQKDHGDDLGLEKEARIDAENAMSYADRWVWNETLGLYYEDQRRDDSKPFSANTQIVGILACARLYALTHEYRYIIKAETLLNSIMKYFWDSGFGGVVSHYSPHQFIQYNLTAYDNALFAYALFQLGIATGAEEVRFKDFILGRPSNEYIQLGMDVMTFMNNFMWKEGEMAGYIEWITPTGDPANPYLYDPSTRLGTSNMLALYNLASIAYQLRPWYTWYFTYVLYGGVALAIILMVTIVAIHRSRAGTKLPKIVKGLLGEED